MAPLNSPILRNAFERSSVDESIIKLQRTTSFVKRASLNTKKIFTRKKLAGEKAYQAEKRLTFRFLERQRRQKRKDLLEASSVKSIAGAISAGSVLNRGKGFLGKIMTSMGMLILGWIANTLPQILSGISILRYRIGNIIDLSKNNIGNISSIFGSIIDIVGQATRNIMNFDFKDREGKLQEKIDRLVEDFNQLGTDFDRVKKEILDITTAPPEEPKDDDQGQRPPTPTPAPAPAPKPAKRDPDLWTLVAVTSLEDSDPQGRADVAQSVYNRQRAGVFPGGKSIKNILIAENGKQYEPVERAVKQFKNIKDRESAIDAYVAAEKVSRNVAAREIDETLKAITNPQLQRNARKWVENRTDFLGAGLRPDRASSTELRRRNAGDNIFGNFVGPGSFEYGRTSRYIAARPPKSVPTTPEPPKPQAPRGDENIRLLPARGTTGSARSRTRRPGTQVSIPYTPIKRGEGRPRIISGYGERWGKMHKGIDIEENEGTPLRAYLPGKVLRNSYDNGYGNYIEWVDSFYDQIHFFAHMMQKSRFKVGQTFGKGAILGRVGSTGSVEGPHLHWEIGPQGSEIDPIDWIKNHPIDQKKISSLQRSTARGPVVALVGTPSQQTPNYSQKQSSPVIMSISDDALNSIANLSAAYT